MRSASRLPIALALTLALGFFFAAFIAAQVTAPGPGRRIHRRAVAATLDIDAALPQIEARLHAAAQESESPSVRVPGFPIPVDLPSQDALALSGNALKQRLLEDSSRTLYDDGMTAWTAGDPAAQSIERISTPGVVSRALGMVRDSWHTAFVGLAVVLGLVSLGLGALVFLSASSGYSRVLTAGGVLLAAALPSLAIALLVRLVVGTWGDSSDPYVGRLQDLEADVVWVAVRDYLAVVMLGLGLVAASGGWRRARGGRRAQYVDMTH